MLSLLNDSTFACDTVNDIYSLPFIGKGENSQIHHFHVDMESFLGLQDRAFFSFLLSLE
jgi:hypothetical protein